MDSNESYYKVTETQEDSTEECSVQVSITGIQKNRNSFIRIFDKPYDAFITIGLSSVNKDIIKIQEIEFQNTNGDSIYCINDSYRVYNSYDKSFIYDTDYKLYSEMYLVFSFTSLKLPKKAYIKITYDNSEEIKTQILEINKSLKIYLTAV